MAPVGYTLPASESLWKCCERGSGETGSGEAGSGETGSGQVSEVDGTTAYPVTKRRGAEAADVLGPSHAVTAVVARTDPFRVVIGDLEPQALFVVHLGARAVLEVTPDHDAAVLAAKARVIFGGLRVWQGEQRHSVRAWQQRRTVGIPRTWW